MKIHHLNCGCMCPIGTKIVPKVFNKEVISHCLLIEGANELILVDCGLSHQALCDPKSMGFYNRFINAKKNDSISALQQIKALGFSPSDVRHIIPTHLDEDHAGAIIDFPNALVHTSLIEFSSMKKPPSFGERLRYKLTGREDSFTWQTYALDRGESWFGFDAVQQLEGLPPEILIVPLYGHTRGHTGIAIKTADKWLFHVGDAYYDHKELIEPRSFRLKIFQKSANVNVKQARENQLKIRSLNEQHHAEIDIFSAHDPWEYERMIAKN